MVTFLSGGTGTPKLLWGLETVYDPGAVTVIANTGDDIELGGLHVSPDVDSVLFERSGQLDRETWWGIADDPTVTTAAVDRLCEAVGLDAAPHYLPDAAQTSGPRLSQWRRFAGVPEFMAIGDRDRAIHMVRTRLLRDDNPLSVVTERLAAAMDVTVRVVPMSNEPIASLIHTPDGMQHFQEFWVAREGKPTVDDVEFRGAATATPAPAVRGAVRDPVIVGPANPVTSLGPMVSLQGVTEWLHETTVVAVSPFVGRGAFSGPAAKLMRATGAEPSTRGMAETHPWIDGFVVDRDDDLPVDRTVERTETKITTREDAVRVLRACKRLIERCSSLG